MSPRRLVPLLLPVLAAVATAAPVRWGAVLRQEAGWYGSADARAVADSVLQYQTAEGGWPKGVDMTKPPTPAFLADARADHRAATIDNGATTTPLRFLALVVGATQDAGLRAAFERGVDYLLAAQYPNGGWPQYFPLRKGYYTHITYNDNAMVNVLTLLREVGEGRAPFAFVDAARRERAAAAVTRGIECILRTQVRQDGRLTAWCAQHDEETLAPAWARNFEPPSLSGSESVGIVKFLMGIDRPSPEVIAAVDAAVAWLRLVAITGQRVEDYTDADGKSDHRLVPDPAAGPLWARFYELGTNRPIYTGRDRVIHYSLAEIERERRVGYGYVGTWARSLLDKDHGRWRERIAKAASR